MYDELPPPKPKRKIGIAKGKKKQMDKAICIYMVKVETERGRVL